MADWNLPILSSLYTEFHDSLKARDNDNIIWLDGSTSTNLPIGAKRWNSTSSLFEKFNGSTWSVLAAKYMINVDQVDGCTVNDAGTTSLDLWTASKITTALNTKVDVASYTAADVLAKLLTVDGSGSGIDADLLDGQTGSYYNSGDNIVWSATPTAGKFNTSATTPVGSTRLNYEGYFYPTWVNLSGSSDTSVTATHYYVETASDGFVRPKTLANVKTEIVTKAAVEASLTGNITTHTHSNITLTSLGLTATATELNYVSRVTSDIQTQLNNKVSAVSPALTGTPTAPTATVGTNTTQIATTAFVLANSVSTSAFIRNTGSNGYEKFPDGTIIQWGSVVSTNTNKTVTFPIAFPNACRQVNVGALTSSAGGSTVVSFTASSAVVLAMNLNNGGVAATAVWYAIGF